jgi:hypothetical protein
VAGGTTVVQSSSGKGARSRRNGRADFLLIAAEIGAAMAAGHTMRRVFEQYEDRLSFGYIQFTRYVKKFIAETDGASVPHAPRDVPATAPTRPFALASSPPSEPQQAPPERPRRFHFDPMSVDRKDLV